MHVLTNVTTVDCSKPITIHDKKVPHFVHGNFFEYGTTAMSAATIKLQGCSVNAELFSGLVTPPAIAIGSTAERIANGAFLYNINGTMYSKGAVAAGTALDASKTIGASKFGTIAMYIDTAGTITYQYPSDAQTYATAALALAAAEALTPVSGTIHIGTALLNADGGGWTSVTDDMTDASDLTTADFTDAPMIWTDLYTHALTAAEITAQNFAFSVTYPVSFVRVVISSLTGNGKFNIYYEGGQ